VMPVVRLGVYVAKPCWAMAWPDPNIPSSAKEAALPHPRVLRSSEVVEFRLIMIVVDWLGFLKRRDASVRACGTVVRPVGRRCA